MTIHQEIAALDEDGLTRELAFAEAFQLNDPDGVAWLEALRAEKGRRQ